MLAHSAYSSLVVQALTGAVDVWGLTIDVPQDQKIFRELLQVELGVQTIEFVFYLWMVKNLTKIKNITPYRYLDWLVTTPVMLVTLMAFLEKDTPTSLRSFIDSNKGFVCSVVALNMAMLVLGLLGELGVVEYRTAVLLGFLPFIYYFLMIHQRYMEGPDVTKEKKALYWFFFVVWSLYGVAALLPYNSKNVSYNVLDLFSKNLFGVFLVYTLWNKRVK